MNSSIEASIHVGSALSAISDSPDGQLLAAGGRTVLKLLRVSEHETDRTRAEFVEVASLRTARRRSLKYSTNDVQWHPSDMGRLATGSTDGSLAVWRVETRNNQEPEVVQAHARSVNRVCWHPSRAHDTLLLSTSQDSTLKLWDTRAPTNWPSFVINCSAAARDAAFNQFTPSVLAVALDSGALELYDLRVGSSSGNVDISNQHGAAASSRGLFSVQVHSGPALAISWHPYMPGILATGGRDQIIRVWSIRAETLPSLAREFHFKQASAESSGSIHNNSSAAGPSKTNMNSNAGLSIQAASPNVTTEMPSGSFSHLSMSIASPTPHGGASSPYDARCFPLASPSISADHDAISVAGYGTGTAESYQHQYPYARDLSSASLRGAERPLGAGAASRGHAHGQGLPYSHHVRSKSVVSVLASSPSRSTPWVDLFSSTRGGMGSHRLQHLQQDGSIHGSGIFGSPAKERWWREKDNHPSHDRSATQSIHGGIYGLAGQSGLAGSHSQVQMMSLSADNIISMQTLAAVARIAWRQSKRPVHEGSSSGTAAFRGIFDEDSEHDPVSDDFTCQIASVASLLDSRIHVWDLRSPNVPRYSMCGLRETVTSMLWSHDDRMYACSRDGLVARFSLQRALQPHSALPLAPFSVSAHGRIAFMEGSNVENVHRRFARSNFVSHLADRAAAAATAADGSFDTTYAVAQGASRSQTPKQTRVLPQSVATATDPLPSDYSDLEDMSLLSSTFQRLKENRNASGNGAARQWDTQDNTSKSNVQTKLETPVSQSDSNNDLMELASASRVRLVSVVATGGVSPSTMRTLALKYCLMKRHDGAPSCATRLVAQLLEQNAEIASAHGCNMTASVFDAVRILLSRSHAETSRLHHVPGDGKKPTKLPISVLDEVLLNACAQFLQDALSLFAASRDVQSISVLSCVLSRLGAKGRTQGLSNAPETESLEISATAERICGQMESSLIVQQATGAYLDILYRFRIPQQAVEVMHTTPVPQVRQLNCQNTRIFHKVEKGVSAIRCAYCLRNVRGPIVWCQGCGHGYHISCLELWFGDQVVCADMHCMHVCEREKESSL